MDLGRLGLFILIGGISIYYGVTQGRTSMMILGIVIAAIGIVNLFIQRKNKKDDEQHK